MEGKDLAGTINHCPVCGHEKLSVRIVKEDGTTAIVYTPVRMIRRRERAVASA